MRQLHRSCHTSTYHSDRTLETWSIVPGERSERKKKKKISPSTNNCFLLLAACCVCEKERSQITLTRGLCSGDVSSIIDCDTWKYPAANVTIAKNVDQNQMWLIVQAFSSFSLLHFPASGGENSCEKDYDCYSSDRVLKEQELLFTLETLVATKDVSFIRDCSSVKNFLEWEWRLHSGQWTKTSHLTHRQTRDRKRVLICNRKRVLMTSQLTERQ